jgi:hypothetical protein
MPAAMRAFSLVHSDPEATARRLSGGGPAGPLVHGMYKPGARCRSEHLDDANAERADCQTQSQHRDQCAFHGLTPYTRANLMLAEGRRSRNVPLPKVMAHNSHYAELGKA